jgi:CBS domain containing-hemolysin-like protein
MDIITLVQAAKAEQAIHNREEIIIIHAATLSARRVRTVMVPTPAVSIFGLRQHLLENVQQAGTTLHRSYPVSVDGSLDEVTGYIRVRESTRYLKRLSSDRAIAGRIARSALPFSRSGNGAIRSHFRDRSSCPSC